jgi:cytoskeleton protein RodZ
VPALGERFRAAREARGLSLSDVAEQIRIRSVYLAAIEEENWETIGAAVYVRGFLRTYARFLGIDPEEAVTEFNPGPRQPAASRNVPVADAAAAQRSASPQGHVSQPERRPISALLVWIASAVAVALIAFVVYNELTMRQQAGAPPVAVAPSGSVAEPSTVPAVSGSELPSALPSPAVSPSPSQANSLALVVSSPSWLRVTVDGNVSMEGTFPAGTTKTFHGKTALVRIGNAGGVDVFVDGRNLGKLGKPGDVVEKSFTL